MNAEPKTCSATTEADPVSETTTVPMWLITLALVLLFLGAWVFDLRGGWFEPKVYGPYTSVADAGRFQPPPPDGPDVKRGKVLFEQNCALCHGNDGMGKPNQAPPLAGSEWVLATGVNRLIRIPLVGLNGPIKVNGQDWNLQMAAMGAQYSDDQLSDLLSYIRSAWGNKASPVTPEQVKKVRDDLKGRSQAYTVDELMKLPE
ncbi:MAG: cytochrome c [Pedosphaera sp.]|nr:cytochrome c [Pedosphaera sp.]